MLLKTDGQLENLEKLTHDIEFAQIEIQVVEGLKQGNEALKKVNDALNIEDIERILDETREAKDKQDVSKLLDLVICNKDVRWLTLFTGNIQSSQWWTDSGRRGCC